MLLKYIKPIVIPAELNMHEEPAQISFLYWNTDLLVGLFFFAFLPPPSRNHGLA